MAVQRNAEAQRRPDTMARAGVAGSLRSESDPRRAGGSGVSLACHGECARSGILRHLRADLVSLNDADSAQRSRVGFNWVRFVDGIHFFARERREEVRLLGF